MTPIYTINEKGQYVLPQTLAGLSGSMATLFAEYLDAFHNFDEADADRLYRICGKIRDFVPMSMADFAAKTLLGIHYTDPDVDVATDQIAIEPELRDNHMAAQMLLSCVSQILHLSPAPSGEDEWDRALADCRAADEALNAASVAYGEVEFGDDAEAIEKANAVVDQASEVDNEARERMMATPASRLADLVFKVDEVVASLRVDQIEALKADILRFANRGDVAPELLELVAEYKRSNEASDAFLKAHPDADNDEFDTVVDPLCDAIKAIVQFPVQTIAELNLKLALIEKEDQFNNTGTKEAVAADVRRLAGGTQTL